MSDMSNRREAWGNSYQNRDNFLFYPNEEVIRFMAKYVRKRTGLNEYRDLLNLGRPARMLDLGCGIGRHVIMGHELGLEVYGIDLSDYAISQAQHWASKKGIDNAPEKIRAGDIRELPWKNNFFDIVISHAVLDSMHFEIACSAIREVKRVLAPKGLFYCDLISGHNSHHSREYAGEEIINTTHEKNTIQSYFNFTKIESLLDDQFEILTARLKMTEEILNGSRSARYHLSLMRK